jgi:DNA-binding GntR family transcriptional regulator
MERKLLPIRLDSYKPLREVVSEALREAIVAGILKPGERLMEIQLAEELGVSRTPVREAIRKLELEGFVIMVPRRGTYVCDLSIKDINEVYEIRTSLDVLAAGLAAERITEEELEQMERLLVEIGEHIDKEDIEKIVEVDTRFHDILYRASRNDRLVGIISNLREQFTRFRTVSIAYPGRLKNTLEEHRRMLEAIAQRNVEMAQQIAREHMENAEQATLHSMNAERDQQTTKTK